MHESSWEGSVDPAVKRGIATFTVDGASTTLALEEFGQFLAINRMLEASRREGERDAIRRLDAECSRTMTRLWETYWVDNGHEQAEV